MLLPLIVTLTLPVQASAADDPIAPARRGMLQCYAPDSQRKACAALASYTPNADGFANRATVRLSTGADPLVTMTTTSQVRIEAGRICGKLLQADLDAAEFRLNGAAIGGESRAQMLKAVATAYRGAGLLDHSVCTRYVPAGDALSARADVDGVARPELTQPVRWVNADEGYAVK